MNDSRFQFAYYDGKRRIFQNSWATRPIHAEMLKHADQKGADYVVLVDPGATQKTTWRKLDKRGWYPHSRAITEDERNAETYLDPDVPGPVCEQWSAGRDIV